MRRGLHSTFQRSWVTWTLGLKIMNSSRSAKHNETQLSRTQLQANFSELQKNSTFAGRDQWLLRVRPLLHRNTDWFHLFVLRTSHESLFRTLGVTQHPNCHPKRKDTKIPHLMEAPAFRENGIAWVSSLGTRVTEHFKPCTIKQKGMSGNLLGTSKPYHQQPHQTNYSPQQS